MKVKAYTYLIALIAMFVLLPASVYAKDSKASCRHSFTDFVSDENATYFLDGTKTAFCDNGCGKKKTVNDKGSVLELKEPESVTAQQDYDQISISWTRVEGADGYRVYYKVSGEWKKCVTSTRATRHTFINLKPGFKVHFAVKAYVKEKGEVKFSEKQAEIYTATKCEAPAKISSEQTASKIKLTWSAVKGADGYRIYYKKNDSWKTRSSFIKGTSVTYKKLPSGKTYTFMVRPVIKADKSIYGDNIKITTSTLPSAPEASVKLVSKSKVSLSWKSVNGASVYQVYYKTDGGKYKLYKAYKKTRNITLELDGDKYYTFAVRAYKKVGKKKLKSSYKPVSVHIGVSEDRLVINPSLGSWNLVLVNKTRELPADYSVKLDYIPDGYRMDYRAAVYYNKMYEAAAKEGIYLAPVSAYRSNELQSQIFEETVDEYIYGYGFTRLEAEKKTSTEVLYPGTSEHNLGFAVDIGCCYGYFEDSAEYRWLVNNAHKYGFIERYKKEKQSITGIIPEPWHWRFVGTEYASKIKNSGLCLEEYLEKYKLIP